MCCDCHFPSTNVHYFAKPKLHRLKVVDGQLVIHLCAYLQCRLLLGVASAGGVPCYLRPGDVRDALDMVRAYSL